MEPEQYADYVRSTCTWRPTVRPDPSSGDMPDDLCEVDPRGVLAETEATLKAIEAEAATAA